MYKLTVFLIFLILPALLISEQISEKDAIDIAYEKWIEIYDENSINNQKPYQAELIEKDFIKKGGSATSSIRIKVWKVTGSLSENLVGGVAEAYIDQNGKVVKITHGR